MFSVDIRTSKTSFLSAEAFTRKAESELRRWEGDTYIPEEPPSAPTGTVILPPVEVSLNLTHLPMFTFFTYIDVKVQRQLQITASTLRYDLQAAWPVDTGRSRTGWSLIATKYVAVVENKTVNPRDNYGYTPRLWYGWSKQMPFGIAQTILDNNTLELVNSMKNKV